MTWRSVLFTPGDRPEMLRRAAETDADALVFDLEDGVAPADRPEARSTIADVCSSGLDASGDVFVRVNPVRTGAGDAATALDTAADDVPELEPVADDLDGVVLPKVRNGAEVRRLAGLLRQHGLPRRVLALVETARGVLAAPEIAAAGATAGLAFGAEDLAADLGATRTDEGTEVSAARQRVVTAARASGVAAIDALWTDYEDVEGLREDARRGATLGYDGKLAIHPDQVGPIHDAFAPSEDEIEWAERILEARDEAEGADRDETGAPDRDDADANGRSAGAFAVDGEMVDAPLLARAERVLERAERRDDR